MKTLLSLLLLTALVPFKSSAQWTTLSSPTTLALDRGAFPNDATGFVACSMGHTVYRTMDGGTTWDSIVFASNIVDIDFVSPDTGFVLVGTGTSYELKTTHNKGNTWTTKTITTPGPYLQTLYFTSAMNGYVVDYNATVGKTTDGGTTFTPSALGTYAYINDKEHIDQDTLILAGWDGTFAYKGAMYRSYDAGATWQAIIHDSTYSTYTGTHFLNGMVGFAVYSDWTGTYTVLAKTIDGGNTWTTIHSDATSSFVEVFMVNQTRGYISVQGTSTHGISITVDGVNWTHDYTTPHPVRRFYGNGNAIWGIGDAGMIVKNATGNSVNEVLEIENTNMYPNPTTGDVHMNFGKPAVVTVFDITGNEIMHTKTFPGEKLDLAHLPNGLYMAKINVDGRMCSAKIVLNK